MTLLVDSFAIAATVFFLWVASAYLRQGLDSDFHVYSVTNGHYLVDVHGRDPGRKPPGRRVNAAEWKNKSRTLRLEELDSYDDYRAYN